MLSMPVALFLTVVAQAPGAAPLPPPSSICLDSLAGSIAPAVIADNLSYLFRLAKVQEAQERFDATESTLLTARNRRPTDVEPYEEAQSAGISGVVQAEITITEQGTVTDATIVRSVPLLDEPALEAVRQWRFEPAIVDGKAVPVRMVVNVNFTLSR
jgi:TonB family protein